MICIRKHNGKTTAAAHCDNCGAGFTWEANISITRISQILRGENWRIGKRDLCVECVFAAIGGGKVNASIKPI